MANKTIIDYYWITIDLQTSYTTSPTLNSVIDDLLYKAHYFAHNKSHIAFIQNTLISLQWKESNYYKAISKTILEVRVNTNHYYYFSFQIYITLYIRMWISAVCYSILSCRCQCQSSDLWTIFKDNS